MFTPKCRFVYVWFIFSNMDQNRTVQTYNVHNVWRKYAKCRNNRHFFHRIQFHKQIFLEFLGDTSNWNQSFKVFSIRKNSIIFGFFMFALLRRWKKSLCFMCYLTSTGASINLPQTERTRVGKKHKFDKIFYRLEHVTRNQCLLPVIYVSIYPFVVNTVSLSNKFLWFWARYFPHLMLKLWK